MVNTVIVNMSMSIFMVIRIDTQIYESDTLYINVILGFYCIIVMILFEVL